MMTSSNWLQVESLPLLLAGPILRRTEPDAVTVWVALRQACQIRLTVYATGNGGQTVGAALLMGDRSTVAVGASLHIAAITARPYQGRTLESDRIYAYDLQFLPVAASAVTLQVALGDGAEGLSYFDHGLPTLVLPPAHWQDLRLVHGSCRKFHGAGSDTLPLLDCLLAQSAADPRQRPHQLFLTGDQIYSDEVAPPLLELLHRLGPALLGWHETLPTGEQASQLPPEQRGATASQQAGLTAGVGNKAEKINSHLLALGEYLSAYLLSLSPTCWPQNWLADLTRHPSRKWRRQGRSLQRFARSLGQVQRSLANIPVYAIFDDHDVSDDWYLNQEWCLQVLGRPLGYRVVQNALLAYALVYGWGNTPWRFTEGQPGGELLVAAQTWGQSGGQDGGAVSAIASYLGLPPLDPMTGLPQLHQDGDCFVLSRSTEALDWHYTVESSCHQIIVLDTRTHRGYPVDGPAYAPPHLLAPNALERQLCQPLQQPPSLTGSPRLTLVVAPTNVFSLKLIDAIHHLHLRQQKVFGSDVGDAWNLPPEALARLLARLFNQRRLVLVLSGDIHFSFAVRFALTSYHPELTSGMLVQLTASSIANEEPLTRLIHTRLKHWLLPEKPRYFQGWLHPSRLEEYRRASDRSATPDWRGTLTWVPRQPAHTPAFGGTVPWQRSQRQSWWRSLQFWRYRWFQEGREVVGHNNLALVQFTASTVQQDCYWYALWAPGEVVYSRMESEIALPMTTPNPKDAVEEIQM